MSELLSIQADFQNFLLQPKLTRPKFIVNTKRVSAETRLKIYTYAYRARLAEVLAENYPVLKSYLGCEIFEELTHSYLDIHPSTQRSISGFGNHLAEFITNTQEFPPYVTEIAQFEWTLTEVFDAADSEILKLEQMSDIPPEAWFSMRLSAHPSARRLNLKWNVADIWQCVSEEKEPPEPLMNVNLIPWIFWRQDLVNKFSSLSDDEAYAIDILLVGGTFGEICEGLCEWVDENDAALHAASLLKGWITSGLIAKIEI